VLSGGERARVALARLLVVPSNVILMDEPTNHLDLDSSERLIEALKEYGGTLLFVSHNRSFINQLATRVWDVRDGGVEEWPGNLDAYLYHLEQIGRPMGQEAATTAPSGAAREAIPDESDRDRRRREAREREAVAARLRPLRKENEAIEREIAALEIEKHAIEPQMAEPSFYDDFQRSRPVLERFQAIESRLAQLYARWAEVQEAIEGAG
jgi:ATP-binding cassette subfamily F protein 3